MSRGRRTKPNDRDAAMSGHGKPKRPRVVCHMMASVDGRIITDDWPLSDEAREQYEQVHATLEADGWLAGRVTMERHFAAGARSDAELAREYSGGAREDFVAPGEHSSYAFAVDPRGRLVWESGELDGDHLVVLLTERVSDEHLSLLRARGVSYLLAGKELDLPLALEKIGARFGVRTLMLEGGGGINGSMLRAGLIDEVSLLLAPVVDGRLDTPTLFDVTGEDTPPRRLVLKGVERRTDDLLWLRYHIK
jgi:2,5-diamino-6-(ribosylamino)-4(3H)-pyrimidinone 5'-phosphate reductase